MDDSRCVNGTPSATTAADASPTAAGVSGTTARPVVPASEDLIHGPTSGTLVVPAGSAVSADRARWVVDLSVPEEQVAFYEAVMTRGTAAEQAQWLDVAVMKGLWPQLNLPAEVRGAWAIMLASRRWTPAELNRLDRLRVRESTQMSTEDLFIRTETFTRLIAEIRRAPVVKRVVPRAAGGTA